jgi:hypothetical protein
MTDAEHRPAELLRHLSHEYLVYEVADHAEHAPNSIGVRLERHGSPEFSVYCTASIVDGKPAQIQTPSIEQAASIEERFMIRMIEGTPQLQSFVREWIEYCHRRYETRTEGH